MWFYRTFLILKKYIDLANNHSNNPHSIYLLLFYFNSNILTDQEKGEYWYLNAFCQRFYVRHKLLTVPRRGNLLPEDFKYFMSPLPFSNAVVYGMWHITFLARDQENFAVCVGYHNNVEKKLLLKIWFHFKELLNFLWTCIYSSENEIILN